MQHAGREKAYSRLYVIQQSHAPTFPLLDSRQLSFLSLRFVCLRINHAFANRSHLTHYLLLWSVTSATCVHFSSSPFISRFSIAMMFLARLIAIMAIPLTIHGQNLQHRAVQTPTLVLAQTPNAKNPTQTFGIVGVPLVFKATPTPTLAAEGKVGQPLHQGGIVGTPLTQAGKVVQTGIVGTPLSLTSTSSHNNGTLSTEIPSLSSSSNSSHTISTTLSLSTPTTTPIVGKPLSSTGSSFFTEKTISSRLPNWAFLVIIICSVVVVFVLVGLVVWRVRKHQADKIKKIDEEDIFEAYTSYWKTKRNSGGIVGQGNISSPLGEKEGRNSFY